MAIAPAGPRKRGRPSQKLKQDMPRAMPQDISSIALMSQRYQKRVLNAADGALDRLIYDSNNGHKRSQITIANLAQKIAEGTFLDVEIPEVKTTCDAIVAADKVMEYTSTGKISVEAGEKLTKMIEMKRRTIEVEVIGRSLEETEKMLREKFKEDNSET